NSLRVGQQAERSGFDGGFGNNFHSRAHLRRAGGVTHNSRKLAGGSSCWRGRRVCSTREARQRQDEGPPGSEAFVFHVALPPGRSVGSALGLRRRFHSEIRRL